MERSVGVSGGGKGVERRVGVSGGTVDRWEKVRRKSMAVRQYKQGGENTH